MFGVTNVQSINGSDGHKPNTEALDDDYELNSDDQSAPACSDIFTDTIFTPFTPFTIQKSPQQHTAALLHCLDVTDAGAGLRSAGVGAPWSRRHVTTIWSPTLTLDCSRTAASAALAHAGSRHQGFPSPSSCSLSASWIICTDAGMSIFAKQTFIRVSIETNDHNNQQCNSVT